MEESMFLSSVVLFLLAAVIAVPLAQRLGIGSVLGYLIAGIAIGPWGLGLIRDVDEILHFSELGVVFLLFIIGLELHPAKLWQLRRLIFGVGTTQVVVTAALLGSVLYFSQFSWQAAMIGGIGLAMSSTAIALQLMQEKGMNRNEGGQVGFSILLCQDLAIIPALALIPILGGTESAQINWGMTLTKIAGLAVIILGGRFLLRPLFRYVATIGMRELFTATALLVVLGSAMIMQALGFSMALGTFAAGVLLAESEFRHELEIAIEPFKGLLLGLFFISVGMALDLGVLFSHLSTIFIGVAIIVSVKGIVLYGLAHLSRLASSVRLQFAVVLSQAGEFAFVLFSAALAQNVLDRSQMAQLLAMVTLSMMTTPLLMQAVELLLFRRYNKEEESGEQQHVEDDNPQVIVVGFGRFGQIVGRLLLLNKTRVTILERDVGRMGLLRKYGYKVYYGDAMQLDLLRAAGAEKAQAIILAGGIPEETMEIIHLCQQYFPNMKILARAKGRVEAHELLQAGVEGFSRETFGSALELGGKALVELGMHPYRSYRAQQHFRRLDTIMLRELMSLHQGDVSQISRVKEARQEMAEVFEREMLSDSKRLDTWEEYDKSK